MTQEFPSLVKGFGEIILSYDSPSPKATLIGRNIITEQSGLVDMGDSIRYSDSVLPNSINITESFDDGILYNWHAEVSPKLSPDTLENITSAGSRDILNAKMLDFVTENLPRVEVERGGNILVHFLGDRSVSIGEESVLYSDQDGDYEVPRESMISPNYASSHQRIDLLMSVDDFFGSHVKDIEGLSISAYVVLRNIPIADINYAIDSVLADKTLDPEEKEIRLRSLVNVVFELRKADNI